MFYTGRLYFSSSRIKKYGLGGWLKASLKNALNVVLGRGEGPQAGAGVSVVLRPPVNLALYG